MPEWKDTCNLPRTAFSMKANLQTAEPEALARWEQIDLYGQLRRARSGAPKFVLHDGPPYANGEIHIGTALNKVLKDLVVKSRSMAGFDAPYVPGWDCHGLPIELKVDRQLGPKKRQMSVADFRRECRAYAAKYVGIMREDFKRLGVFGTWDEPYLTMNPSYQAAIVRALGKFVEQGMVYKGKKPVHWCMHCRTALAEAEVEYEPHTSPSIYVEFPLVGRAAGRAGATRPGVGGPHRSRCSSGRRRRGRFRRIWRSRFIPTSSTAPTPCPAARSTVVIVAKDLAERGRGQDRAARSASLSRPSRAACSSGWCSRIRCMPAIRSAVLGEYVTLEAGTGAVHTAPGHGADDYMTGVKYGLEIYGPLDRGRPLPRDGRAVRRHAGARRESEDRSGAGRARPAMASRGLRPLVSPLLALPQPGDFSGDVAVVHRDGRGGAPEPRARRRSTRRAGSRRGAASASTT